MSEPPLALRPGDVVEGRYRVEALIGQGGVGAVFRARDLGRGGDVAIKVLLAGGLSEVDLARFAREAELVARVDRGGGVVRIHAHGRHAGLAYTVMELVHGQDLDRLLAGGPLPPGRIARIVEGVARTLVACHAAGIVHRDVKPSNILIDQDDRPRLVDFGVARDARCSSRLSATGELIGSPSYMAPEQVMGGEIDARTDVYGLGGVLYHGLTGRPPFDGRTLVEVLSAVVDDRPVAPSTITPGVPRELEVVCLRCLEKEPSRRYPDALELALDLERLGHGGRTVAGADRARERRRSLARWGAGLALGLAILAGVGATSAGVTSLRLARAREALRQARSADERLGAWALGLGAGPAPDAAALPGVVERLRAARSRLVGHAPERGPERGEAGAELDALAERLDGVARRTGPVERLLAAAAALDGPDPDAALDALERDAPRALSAPQARRVLELAWARRLRRDDAPPRDPVQVARQLADHLAQRRDAPGLTPRALGSDGLELALAAPRLVAAAVEVVLREALVDARAAADVAAVASLAAALGPASRTALAAGAARALDQASARRLAARLVEGDPAGGVERLRVALAAAGVPIPAGFLDEVRAALAAHAAGAGGAVELLTEPRLVSAARADAHLARLEPGAPFESLRRLLDQALSRSPRGAPIPLPVLEALVRYDVRSAEERALKQLEGLTADMREAIAAERPWSAVPAYASLLGLHGDEAAAQRLALCEALVQGGMADLHRVHQARVWYELAGASLVLGDGDRARCDRARAACDQAWAVLTLEDRRLRYRFVAVLVQRAFDARRKRLADEALVADLDVLLRRVAGAGLGDRQPDAEARFLGHVGDRIWHERRLPLALEWLERRIVERAGQLGGDPDETRRCQAGLAGLRFTLGRFDEAEAAILPTLPEGLEDDEVCEIAVRIAHARGDDPEARRRLEIGLRAHPTDNDLLDLVKKVR